MNTKDSKIDRQFISQSTMCCDSFKMFIPTVEWMKTDDNVFLMPHIQCGDFKMKINHCPSCGKEVIDIKLQEDEFMSYFHKRLG